ncbi:MAG TPA: hypothetical protein VGO78_00970 [Acidimicrobiales bacterium]|nr:hypothetical protein [Acidimicrobiales bacterium]
MRHDERSGGTAGAFVVFSAPVDPGAQILGEERAALGLSDGLEDPSWPAAALTGGVAE